MKKLNLAILICMLISYSCRNENIQSSSKKISDQPLGVNPEENEIEPDQPLVVDPEEDLEEPVVFDPIVRDSFVASDYLTLPQSIPSFNSVASNNIRSVFKRGNYILISTDGGLSISPNAGAEYQTFTTAQGLKENSVHDSVMDQNGYVYVATNTGVNIFKRNESGRYEEVAIDENIEFTCSKAALFDNKAYLACGFHVYVFSSSEESVKLIGKTDRKERLSQIYGMDIDSSGNIYIATNDGVNIFNVSLSEESNELTYTHKKLNVIPSNLIRTVKLFDENTLLVGCSDGLYILHKGEDEEYTAHGPFVVTKEKSKDLSGIIKSKLGKFYFHNFSSLIYSADINVNEDGTYSVNKTNEFLVEGNILGFNSMVQADDDQFYVSSNNGIIVLSESDDSDQMFTLNKVIKGEGIGNNLVADIDMDSSGKIYVATNRAAYILQKNDENNSYNSQKIESAFENHNLRGIKVSPNGKVYLLGYNKLYILNSNLVVDGIYSKTGLGNYAGKMHIDEDEAAYIATNNGLVVVKKNENTYESTTISSAIYPQLTNNNIQDFMFVENYLYLATKSGIFVFKKNLNNEGQEYEFVSNIKSPQLKGDDVRVLEEHNGVIYAAIQTHGFDKITKGENDVFTVEQVTLPNHQQSFNNIEDIKAINNKLYITNVFTGLGIVDLENYTTEIVNTSNGLPSDIARKLFVRDNKIFIGTQGGIGVKNIDFAEAQNQ